MASSKTPIDTPPLIFNGKLFSGNGNPELAKNIAKYLGVSLSSAEVGVFADGEISMVIKENVRKQDCYIIQSTGPSNTGSPNDMFMELCVMIDALKRGSARSVTAVIPYYGYQRQDRKDYSRAPISASMIARMLESLGIDRVIVFDLHASQIQGFFSCATPLDNLCVQSYFIKYIRDIIVDRHKVSLEDIVVVSPDAGGVKRAVSVSNRINTATAILHKERSRANVVDRMVLMGNVDGKVAVMVDDMIDTGGTACKAAQILKENGATAIYMLVCHGLFSKNAIDRIQSSCFTKVVATNTLQMRRRLPDDSKIEIIDVSALCGEAIVRSLHGQSIKDLYDHDLRYLER